MLVAHNDQKHSLKLQACSCENKSWPMENPTPAPHPKKKVGHVFGGAFPEVWLEFDEMFLESFVEFVLLGDFL